MSSGSSSSSILEMPSYGEGLKESLQAQVDVLSGDLTGTPLQETLERYERPLRKSAAQIDNEVLRQTLLGSQVPVYESITKEEIIPRRTELTGNKLQVDYGGVVTKDGRVVIGDEMPDDRWRKFREDVARAGDDLDQLAEIVAQNKFLIEEVPYDDFASASPWTRARVNEPTNHLGRILMDMVFYRSTDQLNGFLDNFGKAEPQYKKNADGTDFIVPKDEKGEFILEVDETREIPEGSRIANYGKLTGYERAGTGLVDMLGDSRSAIDPVTGLPTDRQAGFDDEGNFLGLAALAEDIQRGNLSRQREADLADVERLSDRFQNVMEDYRPASTSGLDDARILLEQQRENLTGLREATQADVDAGLATKVGEMFQTGQGQGGPISMPSELSADDYAMTGDASIGQLESGEDTLRSALLADARTALSQGLTEREQASITNSARARDALMGRTFDQSGAIAEAQALVAEDNNRRMQNRAFAQSALGQEAGIQGDDSARAMTTDQFNVGAKMDAERLNETLRQQGLGNYINAVGNLAQIEDKFMLDPFQALLSRPGGGSLQAGQGVFGQAGYGLQSGPQYLNPEAGLGFVSQMAANNANMYAANQSANASRNAGQAAMIGNIFGGVGQAIGCWVAREVYGVNNPSWLLFREWMIVESPSWFRNLYIKYGERFARWISDKPRIKSIIRKWMDSKIGGN